MPIISKAKYEYGLQKMKESGSSSCFRRFAFWFLYKLLLSQKRLFEHLQRRGVKVVLWTVNSDVEYEQCLLTFGKSVDGIMTDRPSSLDNYIKSLSETQIKN